MAVVAFDTLKLARRLESAGFSRDQADGAAEALADTFSGEIATKGDLAGFRSDTAANLADLRREVAEGRAESKHDIGDLRTELKTDIANLRSGLKTEISDLRAELKTDLAALRSTIAQWIISAVFVNIVTVLGAVAAVRQLARH